MQNLEAVLVGVTIRIEGIGCGSRIGRLESGLGCIKCGKSRPCLVDLGYLFICLGSQRYELRIVSDGCFWITHPLRAHRQLEVSERPQRGYLIQQHLTF